MADGVRQDYIVATCIQRLAGTEEFAGEHRCEHAGARSGRAVQDEHGFAGGRTDGRVMEAQLRQNLAGVKTEVPVGVLQPNDLASA